MLDIKFIRENKELVEKKSAEKGYKVDVKTLLEVDEKRRKLIDETEKLRSQKKSAAENRNEKEGLNLKKVLKEKEVELEKINESYYNLIRTVPALPKEDVKFGKDDTENDVVKKVGSPKKFDFQIKDHLDLGLSGNLIDVERASKVSGSRFAYLKNELVFLEFALVRFALDTLIKQDFTPVVTPVLINKNVVEDLGYPEYANGDGYQVEDQFLVGTAEHALVPMHSDELLNFNDLPRRYVGFSTCFRKEAGSYGKDTRGIFRVHQFDKVEMVSLVDPKDEDTEHEFLLSQEEKLFQSLEIPYQVVKMCTGDLGFPATRKYDIEAWVPSQEKYREVTSVSTTGDFQARRLNIKYRLQDKNNFVSILNGTAFAIGRTIIAIMENYQQKDGSILVPKVLQPYTNFTKIPA